MTAEEMKAMLDSHSQALLGEVRRMLPAGGWDSVVSHGAVDASGSGLDPDGLARMLAERQGEVKGLEKQLADLQVQLAAKDRRAMELGTELDAAVREVRHKQLDLEFQQLKLEERVRSNADLEQVQRVLSARVAEVSLQSGHTALYVEANRNPLTPRSLRVQGSLPWTLRKNKLNGLA